MLDQVDLRSQSVIRLLRVIVTLNSESYSVSGAWREYLLCE